MHITRLFCCEVSFFDLNAVNSILISFEKVSYNVVQCPILSIIYKEKEYSILNVIFKF